MFEKDKRILIIVESPEKSRTIAKIFKDAGYSKVVVQATIGHFTQLADGSGYWNTGIDVNNNFKCEYKTDPKKKENIKKLKEQIKAADFVYIASDLDREGEAIAQSVVDFLGVKAGKYARITYHEINKRAIFDAIENAHEINKNLVDAARARNCLDKGLGYRLSPVAKASLGCKSVGRCQSAGLKIIADRENEIRSFTPETFYELFLNFTDNSSNPFKAKYHGTDDLEVTKLPDRETVDKIVAECDSDFILRNIERKNKNENSKPPFTTATYQQEAASRLGLSTKTAMSCAQKLFEGVNIGGELLSLVTYLRTDDSSISPEFEAELKEFVIRNYGKDYYSPVKKAKKIENSQEAHEAFRVTRLDVTPDLFYASINNDLLYKVYKLIYDRTVASSMSAAVISETTYNIYNNQHKFVLTSNELVFDGYRHIYKYVEKEKPIYPDLTIDQKIPESELCIEEDQTKPKPLFSEATFLKELQSRGIGRPSTYANIIETILSESRGYCVLDNKQMKITEKGLELSKFLDEKFPDLINLDYTNEMEKDLDLIANGEKDYISFLTEFFNHLEENAGKFISSDNRVVGEVCPKCGKELVMKRGRFGLFKACSGYPDCKYIPPKKDFSLKNFTGE